MTHKHYYEIEGKTNFEFGLRKGELFGEQMRAAVDAEKHHRSWARRVEQAKAYLTPTQKLFPQFIEEYKGYAEGAGVAFDDVWALELDEELAQLRHEQCTTIVTNNGYLLCHNEDWEAESKDSVCFVRRTVAGQTAYEIFYMNGLGGTAVSVNSHGVAQSINSVFHSDYQIGVPKKIIARWLSDASDPEASCQYLKKVVRASGYHHTLVNTFGKVWSLECSAKDLVLTNPKLPFAHTNHFVSPALKPLEENDDEGGTFQRYDFACAKTPEFLSVSDATKLMTDNSLGKRQSLFNKRTIAAMIVDMDHLIAFVWLRRERDNEWVNYQLRF